MATQLPPPQSDRYPHADALRAELTAVVAPWDPQESPGQDRAHLVVAVLTPAGTPDALVDEPTPDGSTRPGGTVPIDLGWLPAHVLGAAARAVADHLPGARVSPQSQQQVQWGSHRPGWSPTAVAVRHDLDHSWRERTELLTAAEAAAALRSPVDAQTFRRYAQRGSAGVPPPVGEIREDAGRGARWVAVWDREQVHRWDQGRPGRGRHGGTRSTTGRWDTDPGPTT